MACHGGRYSSTAPPTTHLAEDVRRALVPSLRSWWTGWWLRASRACSTVTATGTATWRGCASCRQGTALSRFDGPTDIFLANSHPATGCAYGRRPARYAGAELPAEVTSTAQANRGVARAAATIIGRGLRDTSDAKPENVRAMIESVARYGDYQIDR